MSNAEPKKPVVKLVIQQCLSARLELPPDDADSLLRINRGLVTFVCFLQGASLESAEKAALTVCNVKLSEIGETASSSRARRVAVTDLPGDVLVVPQATLGGKLKAKGMQYHGNVDKSLGEELYAKFTETIKAQLQSSPKCLEAKCKVECGVYGARQVLSMETNGPFTHIFEL